MLTIYGVLYVATRIEWLQNQAASDAASIIT